MNSINNFGQLKSLPVLSPDLDDFLKYGRRIIIDKNYSPDKNPLFDVLKGLELLQFDENFNMFHGSQSLAITGANYPYPGLPLPINTSQKDVYNFLDREIPVWFMGDYNLSIAYGNRSPTNDILYDIWEKLYWNNSGEFLVPQNKIKHNKNRITINSSTYIPGYTKIFCYRPKKLLNLILITDSNMKKFIQILDTLISGDIAHWGYEFITRLFDVFYFKYKDQLLSVLGTPNFFPLLDQITLDRKSWHQEDYAFSTMLCQFLTYLHSNGFPVHGYIAPMIHESYRSVSLHPEIMLCKAPLYLDRDPYHPIDWRYGMNYEGLLDSFRKYINKDAESCRGVHRGDVYHHTIWTVYWMEYIIYHARHLWFSWTFTYWKDNKDLLAVYKNALVVASLLHDIGKGGNINKIGHRYDDHPERGFEMIIGTRKYCRYTINGKEFKVVNFDRFLKENNVDTDILKLYVAVSIGMHYDFGLNLVHQYIMMINKNKLSQKTMYNMGVEYIKKMTTYVERYLKAKNTSLSIETIHQCMYFIPLIEFCVGISAADVLGAQYFSDPSFRATFTSIPNIPKNKYNYCQEFPTFFIQNDWNDVGVKIKNFIIDIYLNEMCSGETDAFESHKNAPKLNFPIEPKEILNCYDILGVLPRATNEEIKKKYRRLALTQHPDKGGDPKKFALISAAYDVLGDEEKRNRYNKNMQISCTEFN